MASVVLSVFAVSAQELKWNTDFHFFFDNTEFSRSTLTNDQTMAGVSLTQEIGWKFDNNHYIYGGINVGRSLAEKDFANQLRFLAYYQQKDETTLFKAGSFLRADLLDDYSNFFFQDSIGFYKRTIEGLYLKKGDENHFFKLWLDWTGLQSAIDRESFFLGASGFQQITSLFFADMQSYMFHYATTSPNVDGLSVCDNLQGQLSIGINHSNKQGLNRLMISAGILAGFERDRAHGDDYKTPLGLAVRAQLDYKNFGTENYLYCGQQRMTLYEQYGNALYWSNPFLRSTSYFQNKIYWNAINTKYVKGQLSAKTHVSEGQVFFEQQFTLSASIGNDRPPVRKPTFWERIFPKSSSGKSIYM